MILKELLRKYPFDDLIPDLLTLEEPVKDNLYAFKEAYDDLLRIPLGDSQGELIEVSTVTDTDDDGNVLDRYIHASNCEVAPWDSRLAKEVVIEAGITEIHALALILWHMTFYGFTQDKDFHLRQEARNKYERQAEALSRRQFLNYAKGIASAFEIEHMCLSIEGWKEYERREAHRNRPKRMRDARQNRSIARLKRQGKIQIAIDRIRTATGADEESLSYLFDTTAIVEYDFFSRTPTPEGRAEYIADNIRKYFNSDLSSYTSAEIIVTSDPYHPFTADEARTIRKAIDTLLAPYSIEYIYRFGSKSGIGHDLHIQLLISSPSRQKAAKNNSEPAPEYL
ncbi:MAG: hypothetical protein K6E37_06645 [Bacteroidales bacterium]|nr:hypothetical protein [Bacteroidales bacterium]